MLSKLFNLPWPPEFFWPACLCCTDCPKSINCLDHETLDFTVAVAGVTDGTCTGCDGMNGTYTLDFFNNCSWKQDKSVSPNLCGLSTVQIRLFFNPTANKWQLDILAALGGVTYRLTGKLDCSTSNVFDFSGDPGGCDNWPSTLTLVPV